MLGIMAAMAKEAAPLLEALEGDTARTISGRVFHSGLLCGREVVIVECGIGKVNAAMCAEALILAYKPDLVINVGVGGTLSGDLQIGDIAVARDLVQYDVDTTALGDPPGFVSTVNRVAFPCADWAVDGILRTVADMEGVKARAVRIASGDRFNDDAPTTDYISRTFQAEVCEMEGCPIAQVCWINQTPCAVIRGISDTTAGAHGIEYEQCGDLAAANAARALMGFLEKLDR